MSKFLGLGRRAALLAAAGLSLPAISRRALAQGGAVRIAVQFGYAYLPITVAEKRGLFTRHAAAAGLSGATFAVQRISGAPAINDALISGNVEVGAYGLPGMLIAWEKTRGRIGVKGLAALVAGDNALFVNRTDIRDLADAGRPTASPSRRRTASRRPCCAWRRRSSSGRRARSGSTPWWSAWPTRTASRPC